MKMPTSTLTPSHPHTLTPSHPHTLYESTKYASELQTQRFGDMHGFATVATRLSSLYGPMERITGHRANQSVVKDFTGRVFAARP